MKVYSKTGRISRSFTAQDTNRARYVNATRYRLTFFMAYGSFAHFVLKYLAPACHSEPFYFNTKSAIVTLPASAFAIRDIFRSPIMTVSL
jgi:hypothetical protein